jgi:hypothetical protein
MAQEYSITSTGKPGDFLGGALLTDFIEQWNRTPSSEAGIAVAGTDWTINWQQESPGAKFAHSVVLRTTAGVPQYSRAALLRTWGHYLLTRLPDEGLAEALEGLAETFTYWKIRTEELPSSHPVSNFYSAVYGSSYVRPTFRVTEE